MKKIICLILLSTLCFSEEINYFVKTNEQIKSILATHIKRLKEAPGDISCPIPPYGNIIMKKQFIEFKYDLIIYNFNHMQYVVDPIKCFIL